MQRTAPWLCCCLLLFPGNSSLAAEPASLPDRARSILAKHCARCHGPDSRARGGFGYLLDRTRLVSRKKIVPGKPEASPLLLRIQQGEMPPQPRPRLSPPEVLALQQWIEAGALPFAQQRTLPPLVTEDHLDQLLLADLQSIPTRQRRFIRYLTLSHLANAGASQRTLDRTRQALSKLVNSLSWHPRIRRPVPIDPARTIYRIDLRDYQWNARVWDRLGLLYPYRRKEPTQTAARNATLTEARQPHLRADWFIATASRPPFYHEFLQMPSSDRALERLLRVDVLANLRADNARRAGFNGSGVSRNNRVIERHDAAHGAYWRSYDFRNNTEEQNVFARPLGPLPGPLGFAPDGGEIIFHLPNGLLAYLLVNQAGQRIDTAPVEIVSDPSRPDRRVVTGLSCMGCHSQGMIDKDDQVRAHVQANPGAFTDDNREAILALYPPPKEFLALLKEDGERFSRALTQAGVDPTEPDPIREVVLRYEDILDLATVSAELGTTSDTLHQVLSRSPLLHRTLGALLASGGTIQRDLFEERFPDLAAALPRVPTASPPPPTGRTKLAGQEGSVEAIAFAPQGRLLASAGTDRLIHLWDLPSGKETARLTGHSEEVLTLAISPDGQHLLSGGSDRVLRLWDLGTGKVLHRMVGHTDTIHTVAFSPDGSLAASAGADRTIRLWEVKTGKARGYLPGHRDTITALTFSADGQRLLSGSKDRTVRLWNRTTHREEQRWTAHTGTIHAVAFSPDGTLAASAGSDRQVLVWDLATGKERQRISGLENTIILLRFSADGRYLFLGSSQYRTSDQLVRRWDLHRGKERGYLSGQDLGAVTSLALSPDGLHVALGSPTGVIQYLPLSFRTKR
jgi:WD40 repeat protein